MGSTDWRERGLRPAFFSQSGGKPMQPRRTSSAGPVPKSLPAVYRVLLLGSVLGSVCFTVTWLVEGMTRPGYNALRQPISALSLGPGGWVQALSFIVFGVLVAGSAVGWRAALAHGFGATAIPLLKLVTGLALIVDGLFAQDPAYGYPPGITEPAVASLHESIHQISSIVAIAALAAACFVFAVRFAYESNWHLWALFAVASGMLTMGFMAAFGATLATGPAGLFERLATGVQSLFIAALVVCLLMGTGRIASGRIDVMRAEPGL